LVEEVDSVAAELMASSAGRGEERGGGDGEAWPGLGFGRRVQRGGEGKIGGVLGFLLAAAVRI
jgi:hypothetical protein